MVRKMVMALTALILGAVLVLPAAAQQTGSIRVRFYYGQEAEGTSVVELHRVAEAAGENYRLPDIFGGGVIRREDAHDPELAQWLAEHAGEGGTQRILDADDQGDFSNLGEGLYLLVQRQAPEGYACALPCLIPMPLNGQWEVQAEPKTARLLTQSPQTGDSFSPLLWAMGMILSGMGIWACAENLRKTRDK